VEVRRSLLAAEAASPALLEQLQRDLPVPGPVLSFSVAISHEGSARPIEVVQALAGPEAADAASFVRVSLTAHGPGAAGVDPLDLPALRARTASGSGPSKGPEPPAMSAARPSRATLGALG
jgi:hypothetical protein